MGIKQYVQRQVFAALRSESKLCSKTVLHASWFWTIWGIHFQLFFSSKRAKISLDPRVREAENFLWLLILAFSYARLCLVILVPAKIGCVNHSLKLFLLPFLRPWMCKTVMEQTSWFCPVFIHLVEIGHVILCVWQDTSALIVMGCNLKLV